MVEVVCCQCNIMFLKHKKYYNYDVKHGRQHFCNRQCYKDSRAQRIIVNCGSCGKELSVTQRVIDNSKSGLVFCSKNLFIRNK